MSRLTITRPVVVKIRVTDNYKKAVAAELQEAVTRLDAQLKQLEWQSRRIDAASGKPDAAAAAVRQQLESGRAACLSKRQELLEKLKSVGRLAPGEEVLHGRVESIVELQVGDDWRRVMGAEIVVEDGVVVEIRTGGPDNA
ncbi:YlqD family protein [Desulfotomaculum copahuensis]|uniref:16S rRNA processing protein RimM n=1 Tax=Desulfotomaculum copahuensis TaxID=1838280 RepID=A0A1B7LB30_9FIRM|nr:YlqD family protein [Desulfotomaculum copahuensis]OAT79516.1 hypothetical protein A6M21_15560 [Desulfotomaculum copahuensis]